MQQTKIDQDIYANQYIVVRDTLPQKRLISETLDKGSFFGNNIRAHLLNKPNIEIDIDWPLDLAQARTIARFFKKDLVKIGIIKKGLT